MLRSKSSTELLLSSFSKNETPDHIDFSELADYAESTSISGARIKSASKVLPAKNVITSKEAFRAGAKEGTGSATFYKFIPKVKEIFGKLPAERKGKLYDLINVIRNEARLINTHITLLIEQLDRVGKDTNQSIDLMREATLLSTYFLEDSFAKLTRILTDLKLYTGLYNGNAKVGMTGYIVAGKEPSNTNHPYLLKRKSEKQRELTLLENLANDRAHLNAAFNQLEDLGINASAYDEWKRRNMTRIEVSLNNAKCAGNMTGTAIQGAVISVINFGIAAATLNPVVFSAGTYYAVSTVIKVGEISAKTVLQNKLIRGSCAHALDTATSEHTPAKRTATLSHIKIVEKIEVIHGIGDNLCNSAFGVSSILFSFPVSTSRPATPATLDAHPNPMFAVNPEIAIKKSTVPSLAR